MSSTQLIAKNTIFLYVRMILVMGVSLYTSRIVLQQLGVSDYGLYSLVGGVVALFGFFNSAMSSATQRYLSFDIGKGDENRLQKTFSATLSIHFGISLLVLILAETIGLWYVNYKMIFPAERSLAVNIVYQFSIFTSLLGIIQVPYNALIIAREQMNVFAYVSIVEVILKLIIVFMIVFFGSDKLIGYSILTFVVAFIIRTFYQMYCRKNFKESRYHFEYDKFFFSELISYSGWNLFGNIAGVARGQGVNIVLNYFFGTLMNAAYGITMQVQSAVSIFVTNFQIAVNPQIIKTYSKGELNSTHRLISNSTKYSFFLMLLIVSPIIINTEYVLYLWLKTPPPDTVTFVQLVLGIVLIDCLSGPMMTGAQATGNIKWYQIIVGTLVFLNLPVSWLLLKMGCDAYIVYVVYIVISFLSLQFRLYFLRKMMQFDVAEYYKQVLSRVGLLTASLLGIYIYLKHEDIKADSILSFTVHSVIIIIVMLLLIVVVGTTKNERRLAVDYLKYKILKNDLHHH